VADQGAAQLHESAHDQRARERQLERVVAEVVSTPCDSSASAAAPKISLVCRHPARAHPRWESRHVGHAGRARAASRDQPSQPRGGAPPTPPRTRTRLRSRHFRFSEVRGQRARRQARSVMRSSARDTVVAAAAGRARKSVRFEQAAGRRASTLANLGHGVERRRSATAMWRMCGHEHVRVARIASSDVAFSRGSPSRARCSRLRDVLKWNNECAEQVSAPWRDLRIGPTRRRAQALTLTPDLALAQHRCGGQPDVGEPRPDAKDCLRSSSIRLSGARETSSKTLGKSTPSIRLDQVRAAAEVVAPRPGRGSAAATAARVAPSARSVLETVQRATFESRARCYDARSGRLCRLCAADLVSVSAVPSAASRRDGARLSRVLVSDRHARRRAD